MAKYTNAARDGDLSIRTPLFSRFESDRDAGLDDLVRDVADILGARQALPGRVPGVLNWGLPGIMGLAPNSQVDRERVAGLIAEAIEQFEPRLEQVQVTPIEDVTEFAFRLEAQLVQSDDQSITLRVLSPRRGGGLSADVAVIGGRQMYEVSGDRGQSGSD